MEEKLFEINELLKKWDTGTITDEEVLGIARLFVYIPDGAETKGFIEKFKGVIDSARRKELGMDMMLTAAEEYGGNVSIRVLDPEKGYVPIASSATKEIKVGSEKVKFEVKKDGSFDVRKVFMTKSKTSEELMDFSETIEHVDKYGFVKSVDRYQTLDFDKGVSLSSAINFGSGRYRYSRVSVCDEPDRVRKIVVDYRDGKNNPRDEKSIIWETIADCEHDELGSVSTRQLPDDQEAEYYRTHSSEFVHTHPGYNDDTLIVGGSLLEAPLIESLDQVKDQTRREILADKLKDRVSYNPNNNNSNGRSR